MGDIVASQKLKSVSGFVKVIKQYNPPAECFGTDLIEQRAHRRIYRKKVKNLGIRSRS